MRFIALSLKMPSFGSFYCFPPIPVIFVCKVIVVKFDLREAELYPATEKLDPVMFISLMSVAFLPGASGNFNPLRDGGSAMIFS